MLVYAVLVLVRIRSSTEHANNVEFTPEGNFCNAGKHSCHSPCQKRCSVSDPSREWKFDKCMIHCDLKDEIFQRMILVSLRASVS
jgi:hypothetical protein